MIKITKTYTNYNGVEVTGDYYFNLEKAELLELEHTHGGGLSTIAQRAANAKDMPSLFKIFKDLVLTAYGVKSDDGTYFIKSEEVKEKFRYTKAYSEIFTELATNPEAAGKFIEGILPDEMKEEVSKAVAEQTAQLKAE